jgi:cytoskeleton protein RodZ
MAGKRRKHGQGANPRGDPADGGDAPARTGGAGATMRDERLRNGWELGELAAHLKIRRVHLAAIEDDRFDLLPAGSYAANFVRAYATALGLDPDEMVRRYRAQSGQAEPRLELNFPVPLQESRMPGRIVVLVSVLLAALAYGAWTQFGEHRVLLPRVDPVPEQLQAAAPPLPPPAPPPPAAPAAAEATAAVAVPVQATPPEATPARSPSAGCWCATRPATGSSTACSRRGRATTRPTGQACSSPPARPARSMWRSTDARGRRSAAWASCAATSRSIPIASRRCRRRRRPRVRRLRCRPRAAAERGGRFLWRLVRRAAYHV